MIYGIDLGTTNSLITLHATKYVSPIVASCVKLSTKEVGEQMRVDPESVQSYKVDISAGNEGNMPRAASTLVLKELAKYCPGCKDVVISVPAYFSDNQRYATKLAAENAGLNVKGLVNEPTAAALVVGANREYPTLVMDLGGGTFDVTIIDTRFDMYDVTATDGCVLGGDDFDNTILKFFVKKGGVKLWHLDAVEKAKLKLFCRKVKEDLSYTRADRVIDLSPYGGKEDFKFTHTDYITLMKQTFQKSIDLAINLVNKHIDSKYNIVLVGGSTKNQFYREWVAESLSGEIVPMDYNPDTIVAEGAGYYAYLLESGQLAETVSDVTKALSIEDHDGKSVFFIDENAKVPTEVKRVISNSDRNDKLILRLYQGSKELAKDNEFIGYMEYDYHRTVEAGEGIVYVTVSVDTNGCIYLKAAEPIGLEQSIIIKRLPTT